MAAVLCSMIASGVSRAHRLRGTRETTSSKGRIRLGARSPALDVFGHRISLAASNVVLAAASDAKRDWRAGGRRGDVPGRAGGWTML